MGQPRVLSSISTLHMVLRLNKSVIDVINVVDVLLYSAYHAAHCRADLSLIFTQICIYAFHLLDRARLHPAVK